jgi:GNAT superfamily N-acetyltransferase
VDVAGTRHQWLLPPVRQGGLDWWQILGEAGRLWAGPGGVEVGDEWWTAFSGRSNINYNLSCCHSSDPDVLVDRCLNPTLQIGKPALIMLSGPGLVTAQKLVESRWVTVGALPLMALPDPVGFDTDRSGVERLDRGQLGSARQMLAECYGLDLASAETAFPDAVADRPDMAAWGLFAEGRLVSCVATVRQDGVVVVWSMATRPDCQKRGYGRRLLETVLNLHFEQGASASLLHSSRVAEVLYAQAGYRVVEYLQLWSRPRWALGVA